MRATDIQFAGSIPELYDRYMVPLFFRPYAELVAERARILQPRRILETAAGTGVVTETLHRALPDAEIVATDLNPPMLEEAARRVGEGNVSFLAADALDLPFAEASFDLVVCQFGVMFFPDKVRGNAEAFRMLVPGGTYLLVIWDSVDRNLATKIAGRAVADLFPDDPTAFKPSYEHSFYPGQIFGILGPTPADAIPEIQRLVELGVRHFQIGLEDLATVRRFVAEVVPAFE